MIRVERAVGTIAAMFVVGCGDPYARYASLVYRDVDASVAATWEMSSRVQLTAVHGTIPSDSMMVVQQAVATAARAVRAHAEHFDAADAPSSIMKPHLLLRAGLLELAKDLDSLSAAATRCSSATSADSANFSTCAADVTKNAQEVKFAMDDLSVARERMQRSLYSFGVILGAVRTSALDQKRAWRS